MLVSADARLIEWIQQATRGGRVLLCSLGRRGKAMERDDPERAELLLTVVRAHPLYKAGRLAFDMLEIEDLMLDGPPVDQLGLAEVSRALGLVASRVEDLLAGLRQIGVISGNGPGPSMPAPPLPLVRLEPAHEPTSPAPELQSSDYLYDFVVLGLLDALSRSADPEAA